MIFIEKKLADGRVVFFGACGPIARIAQLRTQFPKSGKMTEKENQAFKEMVGLISAGNPIVDCLVSR